MQEKTLIRMGADTQTYMNNTVNTYYNMPFLMAQLVLMCMDMHLREATLPFSFQSPPGESTLKGGFFPQKPILSFKSSPHLRRTSSSRDVCKKSQKLSLFVN